MEAVAVLEALAGVEVLAEMAELVATVEGMAEVWEVAELVATVAELVAIVAMGDHRHTHQGHGTCQ